MVCLRWMRRAYSRLVRGFNQKLLLMFSDVFYRLGAAKGVTLSLSYGYTEGLIMRSWRLDGI